MGLLLPPAPFSPPAPGFRRPPSKPVPQDGHHFDFTAVARFGLNSAFGQIRRKVFQEDMASHGAKVP